MIRAAASLLCTAVLLPSLGAQAAYTATRNGSFQVGVAVSSYQMDYSGRVEGFTLYGDANITHRLGVGLGVEALYRYDSLETPHDLGQNNLLIGPRFHITRRRFSPYGKLLAGEGIFDFQQGFYRSPHTHGYFMYSLGAGLDIRATHHLNLRLIDFEYQVWPTFGHSGLTPHGYSAGAAYRF